MSGNPYRRQDGPPDYNYAMNQHGQQDGSIGNGSAQAGQTLQPSSAGNVDDMNRASMEDEMRELPEGWIREWDPKCVPPPPSNLSLPLTTFAGNRQKHHFYVDTKANPPRSIWVHPYDDPQYISSIPDKHPAKQWAHAQQAARPAGQGPSGAAAAGSSGNAGHKPGLLTKMHDKLTGTTKEERDAQKEQQRQRQIAYDHVRPSVM
ncbi:hypothetical protein CALVIDRAFT_268620 [Calocera viscosa TUFC12733]|uniref:WW domain-containing protein n=1 Tax=Calocera viscosa (strain TUFC12733) TaxID=1330018 RepID=A0A167J0N3_CALVF|nr:hypothetical protein CALVIDRAFT_268620 [Calocera viscosa TUFC12733]